MQVGSASIYTSIPNVLESAKSVDSSCQLILQLEPDQINSNLFAVLLTCYIVFCVQPFVDRVPILSIPTIGSIEHLTAFSRVACDQLSAIEAFQYSWPFLR